MALRSWIFVALSGLALCRSAQADENRKRPLPDYDGRPDARRPADVVLWIPRLLLSPAYVVAEFVIRRPLGFLITEAERAQLPSALYDFFAFGPDHKAGFTPIAFVDFGFEPSVGLYAFWDDAGFKGHDLRVRGSTWGSAWLAGTVTERFRFSEHQSLTLSGTLIRRPDYAFYGIGPDSRESQISRYGSDRADARVLLRTALGGANLIETSVGYRGARFRPGAYDEDPALPVRVSEGAFALPPGYQDGYRAVLSALRVVLDTRTESSEANRATQSDEYPLRSFEDGARLELEVEHGTDPGTSAPAGWLRYGATIGGFLDLGHRNRVLSLSFAALGADALGARPVPFTELVTLGGPMWMPGFRAGRLYGESALLGTLRYSWPIWMWLDGSLQASVGNVFGEHWAGASLARSRFSGALGLETNNSRDSIFQALVGFGTETFESGASVNSIRVALGARHGF
ncbi:MAG TPA: hypothetical protein VFQ61_25885 [Polyangiaceae bacterium]|nr:hypothetical protein [Polyangiaceae bacterium]